MEDASLIASLLLLGAVSVAGYDLLVTRPREREREDTIRRRTRMLVLERLRRLCANPPASAKGDYQEID